MDIIIKVPSTRFAKLARDLNREPGAGSYTLGKTVLPGELGRGDTAWFITKHKGTWVFAAWATITGVQDSGHGRSAQIEWQGDAGLVPEHARVPSCFAPAGARTWDTACAEVTADFVRVLDDLERENQTIPQLGALGNLITRDELGTMYLPIESIEPSPDNPRTHFDEDALLALAASIAELGVIQPIVVRPSTKSEDRAELVVGERRWRASRMVGLTQIPIRVAKYGDADTLTRQLVENDQREAVTPLEEAEAVRKLIQAHGQNVEEVALAWGRSTGYVRARLALLELIPEIRQMLASGLLGLGAAVKLSKLPAGYQQELAQAGLCTVRWGEGKGVTPQAWSLALVNEFIRSRSRLLAKAPWELGEVLVGCRACLGCPHRSSAQTSLLPDDVDAEDRCLDKACYGDKLEHALEKYVEEVVAGIPGAEVFGEDMRAELGRDGWYEHYHNADSRTWVVDGNPTWGELVPETTRYVFGLAYGSRLEHHVLISKVEALAELKERNPIAHARLTGEANEASLEVERKQELVRARTRERIGDWAKGLDDRAATRVVFGLLGAREDASDEESSVGELLAAFLGGQLEGVAFERTLSRLESVSGQVFLEEGS